MFHPIALSPGRMSVRENVAYAIKCHICNVDNVARQHLLLSFFLTLFKKNKNKKRNVDKA